MVAVNTDHMSHNGTDADGPGSNGVAGADGSSVGHAGPADPIRSFSWRDYPLERILAAKGDTTVSVAMPARNEEATVGPIVACVHEQLLAAGVVDELLVIDDGSVDSTAQVASDAGARVVRAGDLLGSHRDGHGKGAVLWKSLLATSGEIVLWCDTDLVDFEHRLVSGLLGPLLCEDGVDFAKGFYRRPDADGGGGRVTELVAKPLISLLFPELASLVQPLAGEYGGRRSLLEQLPFAAGYGVEIGLLVDIAQRFGTARMAQVDLEVRHHRNRPLAQLTPQATAIMQTALRRVDQTGPARAPGSDRAGHDGEDELPPMIEVPEYLRRHAPEAVAV
ncbi:MAG: glucosyl-3-phosphoglycerate synthase [Microthrixaceae bacterium]